MTIPELTNAVAIKNFCQSSLTEIPFPGSEKYPEYSIVEQKIDGWWVGIPIYENRYHVITSGGGKLATVDTTADGRSLLVAEWCSRTNWVTMHPEEQGKFRIHDAAMINGLDITGLEYQRRWELTNLFLANNQIPMFSMLPWYPRDFTEKLWNIPDSEGIVLKKPNGFGAAMQGLKVKHSFEVDYVCVAMAEGGGRNTGRLGALVGRNSKGGTNIGGGFSDGQRIEYWNNKEKYIGKVFSATGKAIFSSGSLRHGNFLRWREDKNPDDVRD